MNFFFEAVGMISFILTLMSFDSEAQSIIDAQKRHSEIKQETQQYQKDFVEKHGLNKDLQYSFNSDLDTGVIRTGVNVFGVAQTAKMEKPVSVAQYSVQDQLQQRQLATYNSLFNSMSPTQMQSMSFNQLTNDLYNTYHSVNTDHLSYTLDMNVVPSHFKYDGEHKSKAIYHYVLTRKSKAMVV